MSSGIQAADQDLRQVGLVYLADFEPFKLAVAKATNLSALIALKDLELKRDRPRKTRLRAINERIEVLTEWKEIPLEETHRET